MYVKIGPPYHWCRPARWLKKLILWCYGFDRNTNWDTVSKQQIDKYEECEARIHSFILYTWLQQFEQWLDSRVSQTVRVRVHDYDVWSMDYTLSLIVLPMLQLLKKKKPGAPFVDDDDVPEELRSSACPPVEEWETDANHFKRWDWVINEMIWAFEQLHTGDDNDAQFFKYANPNDTTHTEFDKEGYLHHHNRLNRGLQLFGKYFRGLWD